jgi:hypothetical protein
MPKGLRTLGLSFAEPHLTHFGVWCCCCVFATDSDCAGSFSILSRYRTTGMSTIIPAI